MSSVVLATDGIEPLDLNNALEGWVTTAIDVSVPEVRESRFERPGAHGSIDYTHLMGDRSVVLKVAAVADPQPLRNLVDRLAPFLDPGRRSVLTITDEDTSARRSLVVRRADNFAAPWKGPALMDLTIGLRTVGSPFFTGEERAITLLPNAPSSEVGMTPPLVPPLVLDVADDEHHGIIRNDGSVPAYWRAQVDGPADGVAIRNDTTGETVSLEGLNLLVGQTLIVDSYERSVTVDGESRYAAVDPASSWWRVPVGESQVSAPVSAWATPAQVWFRWSDTYLI